MNLFISLLTLTNTSGVVRTLLSVLVITLAVISSMIWGWAVTWPWPFFCSRATVCWAGWVFWPSSPHPMYWYNARCIVLTSPDDDWSTLTVCPATSWSRAVAHSLSTLTSSATCSWTSCPLWPKSPTTSNCNMEIASWKVHWQTLASLKLFWTNRQCLIGSMDAGAIKVWKRRLHFLLLFKKVSLYGKLLCTHQHKHSHLYIAESLCCDRDSCLPHDPVMGCHTALSSPLFLCHSWWSMLTMRSRFPRHHE